MYTVASYVWLCSGIKKGLTPLGLSLSVPKLGIFCHVWEGIWVVTIELKSQLINSKAILLNKKLH